MSLLDKAALLAENSANIASASAPESILPSIHGQMDADIIDSMWNRANNPMPNGDTSDNALTTFLASLQNQLNFLTVGTPTNPNLFRAEKTVVQNVVNARNPYVAVLDFEDDISDPNYDVGNKFYSNKFVAIDNQTLTFIAEKVNLKAAAINHPITLMICKNGNLGSPLASSTAIDDTAVDDYGNTTADTDGYTFSPVIAKAVTVAAGDEITVVIYAAGLAGGLIYTGPATIQAGAIFSNTQ